MSTGPVQFGKTPEELLGDRPAPERAARKLPVPPRPTNMPENVYSHMVSLAEAQAAGTPVTHAPREHDTPQEAPAADSDPEGQDGQDDQPTFWNRNDPWADPEVRRRIERGCSPMTFEDLLVSGRVTQRVRVREGLDVLFQCLTGEDGKWAKQWAFEQSTAAQIVYTDELTFARLAIGVKAINGALLPDFEASKAGQLEVDPKRFKERRDRVARLPEAILQGLLNNQIWFEDRVRRLVLYDDLKNG